MSIDPSYPTKTESVVPLEIHWRTPGTGGLIENEGDGVLEGDVDAAGRGSAVCETRGATATLNKTSNEVLITVALGYAYVQTGTASSRNTYPECGPVGVHQRDGFFSQSFDHARQTVAFRPPTAPASTGRLDALCAGESDVPQTSDGLRKRSLYAIVGPKSDVSVMLKGTTQTDEDPKNASRSNLPGTTAGRPKGLTGAGIADNDVIVYEKTFAVWPVAAWVTM